MVPLAGGTFFFFSFFSLHRFNVSVQVPPSFASAAAERAGAGARNETRLRADGPGTRGRETGRRRVTLFTAGDGGVSSAVTVRSRGLGVSRLLRVQLPSDRARCDRIGTTGRLFTLAAWRSTSFICAIIVSDPIARASAADSSSRCEGIQRVRLGKIGRGSGMGVDTAPGLLPLDGRPRLSQL